MFWSRRTPFTPNDSASPRDRHDDLGARLNRLALLSSATEAADGELAGLARESARAMDEIVSSTRPEHDSVTHFADYLGAYASEYLRDAGLRVQLDLPESEIEAPLTAAQRHDLVLVAKELLRKVVEHAQARTVWVRVRWQAGVLAMEIADDGVGMEPSAPHEERPGRGSRGGVNTGGAGRHDGLGNVRMRVERLGGRVVWEPREGGGTRVRVEC